MASKFTCDVHPTQAGFDIEGIGSYSAAQAVRDHYCVHVNCTIDPKACKKLGTPQSIKTNRAA